MPGRALDPELRVLGAADLEHRGRARDRLDVVDRGRRGVEAGDGGERRLRPRLAAPPFERLEQRRLLAADVGAGAAVEHDRDVAEELLRAHLLERGDEHLELGLVLAADVDEDVRRLDRARRDQRPLEEAERDAEHDLAVLERARLRLVGVDHEVVRLVDLVRLRDEAPLAAGREEGAAAAAQVRGVELLDDLVGRHRARLRERLEAADGLVVGDLGQRAAVRAGEDDLRRRRHRRSFGSTPFATPRSSATIRGTSSACTCSR